MNSPGQTDTKFIVPTANRRLKGVTLLDVDREYSAHAQSSIVIPLFRYSAIPVSLSEHSMFESEQVDGGFCVGCAI